MVTILESRLLAVASSAAFVPGRDGDAPSLAECDALLGELAGWRFDNDAARMRAEGAFPPPGAGGAARAMPGEEAAYEAGRLAAVEAMAASLVGAQAPARASRLREIALVVEG